MDGHSIPTWDVIIAGMGPGGGTAAQLLARAGHSVLALEKANFPRFHIGESLLPLNLELFSRLGLDLEGTAVKKLGAEFLDETTNEHKSYPFGDGLPGTSPHAYQVERARFDQDLAVLAARAGAEVQFGAAIRDVVVQPEQVTVSTDTTTFQARYFVDATGQDALLGRKHRTLAPIRGLGKVAEYTHFEKLSPSIREELTATGNVKVIARDGGWAWAIPLAGGRLSLGVVTKHAQTRERSEGEGCGLVDHLIEDSPEVRRLTAGATRGSRALARNFAYRNTAACGARYVCIGDAAAFIDPVFSSGVAVAMESAERVCDALTVALSATTELRAGLMNPVLESLEVAYDCFGSMAQRFYGSKVMENLFLAENPDPIMRAGLISVLAGDVFRDDNPFQNALLRGRRRFRIRDVLREPTDYEKSTAAE